MGQNGQSLKSKKKLLIETTKDNKEIDVVKTNEQENNTFEGTKSTRREILKLLKLCELTHTKKVPIIWLEMLMMWWNKTFWENVEKPEQTDPQR